MAEYNPELPVLTLRGTTSGNAVGKDKYGISDNTGLGPNGADKHISYDIIINSITAQSVGDASVRNSSGLGVGGSYNGIDVKVGDWVTDNNGAYVMKITAISEKTSTHVSCSVEDVGMTNARMRSDRVNVFPNGTTVIIFECNDEEEAVFAQTQMSEFAGGTQALGVASYFNVYKPFQRFTFYPENTGSLKLGDLVTITSSGNPYTLITASQDDSYIIGSIADLYGGNNVNVRPFNKIITNFDAPEKVSYGSPGTIWYLSGSNTYTTSSVGDAKPIFLQVGNATQAEVTGSVSDAKLDETQENLKINGVDVIPVDSGGSTLTIGQITASVNESASITGVSASIDIRGGGFASVTTNQSLAYSPDLIIPLDGNTGPIGTYSSAPGQFAITHSGGGSTTSFSVRPTVADTLYSNYPVASEEAITTAINSAADTAGANITASFGTNTITITATAAGSIEINNEVNDPFGSAVVGAGSGTGLPTGEVDQEATTKFLALFRPDGGNILLEGNFITGTSGSGLYSVAGTPPHLLMLERSLPGSGGSDTDWFEADTYLTASKDIKVTGSLLVNRQNADGDFIVITSGSYNTFKINSEGVAEFFAYSNSSTPTQTAVYGGLLFQSASVWAGID